MLTVVSVGEVSEGRYDAALPEATMPCSVDAAVDLEATCASEEAAVVLASEDAAVVLTSEDTAVVLISEDAAVVLMSEEAPAEASSVAVELLAKGTGPPTAPVCTSLAIVASPEDCACDDKLVVPRFDTMYVDPAEVYMNMVCGLLLQELVDVTVTQSMDDELGYELYELDELWPHPCRANRNRHHGSEWSSIACWSPY